jgi:hypothetical protein
MRYCQICVAVLVQDEGERISAHGCRVCLTSVHMALCAAQGIVVISTNHNEM